MVDAHRRAPAAWRRSRIPASCAVDEIIPELAEAGLAAIEVYHPDHDRRDIERYRRDGAHATGLLVTGGSDYHGPGSGRPTGLGRVALPREDFERLRTRAGGLRRTS